MRRKPRLWVIDPSLHHAEEQGVAEILRDWTGSTRLFQPALEPGSGPAPETGCDADGIVLLGSAASVYDDEPWLAPLAGWLRPLLRGRPRIPVLGICFGHQFVAHLAGGKVDWVDERRTKVLGVESSRLSGGRLIPGEQRLRVVVSHREEVKQAPPHYRICASRPNARIDGLEHEDLPIYTFQFHPEAREEFARRAGIDVAAIDDRLRQDSRRLLGAFLDEVRAGCREEEQRAR